jgi:hypothetical protein
MNNKNLPVASVKDRDVLPMAQEIGQAFDGDERPAQSGRSLYDD